jgi:hypothetical protein
LNDKNKDDVFIQYQKQNEKKMKVVVALFVLFMVFVLYYMLNQ